MVPHSAHYAEILRPSKVAINLGIYEPKIQIDGNYVHQKDVVEKATMTEIAREFFTSRQTIRRRLLNMGVPLRSILDKEQKQKHTKFGHRKIKGETVQHKAEQRAINSIEEMGEKSLSFQNIADILHQMKIPTKTKGKKWTKGMVRNVYLKI